MAMSNSAPLWWASRCVSAQFAQLAMTPTAPEPRRTDAASPPPINLSAERVIRAMAKMQRESRA